MGATRTLPAFRFGWWFLGSTTTSRQPRLRYRQGQLGNRWFVTLFLEFVVEVKHPLRAPSDFYRSFEHRHAAAAEMDRDGADLSCNRPSHQHAWASHVVSLVHAPFTFNGSA